MSGSELTANDLVEFLKRNGVQYEILYHGETYSAEKASKVLKVDIKSVAKSVLFMTDLGTPVLVVLRGDKRVSQNRLAKELGFKKLRLATEEEVVAATGYRPGAIPPVGHKSKILTVVDRELNGLEYVFCGGGSVGATLKIRVNDIIKLQDAKVMDV